MPRLDGTGPNGQGSMTGRGTGNCGIQKGEGKQYFGRGCGRGFWRGVGSFFGRGRNVQQGNNIDFLKSEAENLKNRLDEINKIIDSEKTKE